MTCARFSARRGGCSPTRCSTCCTTSLRGCSSSSPASARISRAATSSAAQRRWHSPSGITLVTYFMNMTIVFGVLHLLASCMLLFGLTRGFWEALPAWVLPVLCLALIFLTAPCADGVTTQTPQLWLFGFTTPDFASADYFPLLPWFFVFLLGTWAGRYVKAGPPAAVVLHGQSAASRPRRASRAAPLRSAPALALRAHHAAPAHFYPIGGPRCTTERSKTATLPTARASA